MEWKDIEKVNKEISTVEIPAKKKDAKGNWVTANTEYVEVKERVIAYRKLCPNGKLTTEVYFTDNYVMATAKATDNEGNVLAVGHARELLNKSFCLENAETSAIGRCLGFMGLGINTSIATKEDMELAQSPSGLFDTQIEQPNLTALVDKFKALYTLEEQVKIMNKKKVTTPEQLGAEVLKLYIRDRE